METTTHYSPQITFENMASPNNVPDYFKFEDLNDSSPSHQHTPPPVIVHSKPAKKRKSWGQQLPEPTTALPPRKRAKTEDEKEQRRIERIKRNRAAAHNSRERKRQETDVLAVKLARANAELEAYRNLHGPLPSSVVLPEVTLSTVDPDCAETPAPSLIESRGSVDYTASPPSPSNVDDLFDTDVVIKQEPELSYPTPMQLPAFDLSALHQKPLSLLDSTQHSAEMLCDLPCRSRQRSSNFWWTTLFLYIMSLQLQTTYKTCLLAMWSHSPSSMARMMRASTQGLTSRSMTGSRTPLQLSRSTAVLAQRKAATHRFSVGQGTHKVLQERTGPGNSHATTETGTAAEQQHLSDTKAFKEQHGGKSGLGSTDADRGVGR